MIADDERRYVAANQAACELLGVTLHQLHQKRIDDFTLPEARADLDDAWAEFLAVGFQSARFTLALPDGATVDIDYRGVANILPGRHLSLMDPSGPVK